MFLESSVSAPVHGCSEEAEGWRSRGRHLPGRLQAVPSRHRECGRGGGGGGGAEAPGALPGLRQHLLAGGGGAAALPLARGPGAGAAPGRLLQAAAL